MEPSSHKGMLGILSLDTAFPRIIGDVGNPLSYPFAAKVRIVPGADSPKIVQDGLPDETLLQGFEDAARALEHQGAAAIVSTCGFLITARSRIARAVRVPVMLSALSLFPVVRATTPGRIGILTASGAALGPPALAAAGIAPDDVVIQGMEHEHAFAATFLAPRDRHSLTFDPAMMEQAVLSAGRLLLSSAPDIRAILLECGNLPPYAPALRAATGLPVYHLLDAARWMMSAQGVIRASLDALTGCRGRPPPSIRSRS